jgi:thiamine pyrophosphokinase
MNEIVIVVTGADPLNADAVAHVPADAIVLAADGGLDHALAAGLTPAGVIGDLDSISDDGLAWAEAHATIHRHPREKDRTDTELTLGVAADLAPARIVLMAGGGDRLDHTIAAIGALGHPELTSVPVIEGWWGSQHFHVLQGPGRLRLGCEVGSTISLIATHGTASGVSISGCRWDLDDADVEPLTGLGISNEATSADVEITVSSGVLTVFSDPPAVANETP